MACYRDQDVPWKDALGDAFSIGRVGVIMLGESQPVPRA